VVGHLRECHVLVTALAPQARDLVTHGCGLTLPASA
jgi:hypothetical protein